MTGEIFTIGHSSHDAAHFIALLKRRAITAVADVRSQPYSRRHSQFRKRALEAALKENGIAYVFLGRELGARSDKPRCYVDGRVQYARLAREPSFQEGIERVLAGMKRCRIALLCAEEDPARCHRAVLVGRALRPRVARIGHIRGDSSIEWNPDLEQRLTAMHDLAPDMLSTGHECIEQAYERQAVKIAYVDENMKPAAG